MNAKKDPDPPPQPKLTFECAKCGTPYPSLAEALACGCARRGEE